MDPHPKVQIASDGSLLLNFGRYGEEVEVASISSDGRRVLTVREVGKAEIWDAASGERVGEICPDSPLEGTHGTGPTTEAFEVFIEAAALSPDRSAALLGLNDGSAGIFRVADGARLATLRSPAAPAPAWGVIRAVAYSPDGTLALVGFPGRAVGVWSDRGEPVAFLTSAAGSKLVGRPFVRDTLVSAVAASADRRWVFAGCTDMTAALWELETGELELDATEHAEATLAVFDGVDGTGWATTAGSVWCVRDGVAPHKVVAAGGPWAEVRAHRDALITRSHGGEISLWRLSGEHTPLFQPAKAPKGYWSDRAESLALRGERDLDYLYPRPASDS